MLEKQQELVDSIKNFDKKQKKLIKRQPSASSRSNDSKRNSSNKDKSQTFPTYINILKPSQSLDLKMDRFSLSKGLGLNLISTPKRKSKVYQFQTISTADPLTKNIGNEQEQIHNNQQPQCFQQNRRCTRKQCQKRELKLYQISEKLNQQVLEIDKYKQQVKKLTITKLKLQSQITSLEKKIQFLDKFSFSTDTKNVQSLRQTYLEKQIQILKDKIKQNETQIILPQEFVNLQQQLFSARKKMQAMQVSNDCLKKKLERSNRFAQQQNDYSSLYNKYKKILLQYKQTKKSYQFLQKQNEFLRLKVSSEGSLSFSGSNI